ncbi:histidinol phosphate phosphatase [Clostridium bovifaecis]|uniref:Histidinol-phosphatase n=1 Tax=Clostridium bovifaecis TaxID=2184719 RepID=A0A6I6ETG9_9CLOT|nr:histidinol phosphate phosphatase [Clostridium bovifaecis]
MFDTHMHTKFSTDSKMKIEEVIYKIKKYNLGAIITEHVDLNYKDSSLFRIDPDDYFKSYSSYRTDKLLLGVEIGMSNKFSHEYENLITNYSFDYVIGSLHEMYDIDLFEADELYKSKSKKELYEEYFAQMVSCINEHPFIDSLGHIDYICRYAKYEDTEIYYEDYKESIEEVLKTIIDKGIAMELNARRLGDKEVVNNLLKIYARYYELGGRFITIGSDAHTSEAIGSHFNIANDMAELCNLKMIYFKDRKMELVR